MYSSIVRICARATHDCFLDGHSTGKVIRGALRYSSSKPKRFYKQVGILQAAEGNYELHLDKSKLKTPMGKLFSVPNEPLAIAVAQEWDAQGTHIHRQHMHITRLCNIALDTVDDKSKEKFVEDILSYLETDTVCYRYSDPPGLEQFETALWDPLLLWFTKRYNVQLSSTLGLNLLDIPDDTKRTIQRHLLTYNAWALVGILHAVEALKSVVIMLALIDKFVSVEQAVYFSRLECEFQISKWGNVEEAHDMEKTETQARAAAATLFVHMCSETERAQHKLQQPPQ